MNYKEYNISTFLQDEEFKKWVLKPDSANTMFWQEFLQAHPEQKSKFQTARNIILSIHFDEFVEKDEDKQQMFQKILLGSKSNRGIQLEKKKNQKTKQISVSIIYKVAASLLLILGAAVLWQLNSPKPIVEEIATNITIKENPKGRKSTVQLPDGSIVKLNSESRIYFPEQFPQDERVVHLVGEAFFEVTENKESPFSVVTGDIMTTALGTSFNVQAWENDSTINIALAEGKISVTKVNDINHEKAFYLHPGDKITHDKLTDGFKLEKFDLLSELGWKDGIIIFNKSNLAEVTSKLSRWYDVEFEVVGKQEGPWSFDGRFENESLKDVLETISYTYKLDYIIENKKVILKL